MKICVFGASSSTIDKSYVSQVEELGRKIADRGHGLVYGAGASGLMGAVARGVYEKKGEIVGVVPNFLMMKIWVLTAVFSKTVRNLSERTQCVKENV